MLKYTKQSRQISLQFEYFLRWGGEGVGTKSISAIFFLQGNIFTYVTTILTVHFASPNKL